MKRHIEDILDELECEIITAQRAQRDLDKMKRHISEIQYKEAQSLIADYLYEEAHEREPEIADLILEEIEPAQYDWDEDQQLRAPNYSAAALEE
jgi:hypothetical protein